MERQNYANHIRYYKPHHFIFYPVVFALGVVTLVFLARDEPNRMLWLVAGANVLLLGLLSLMLRQHYSLINQNRIVRLELRFRYYVLTQKRFEEIEKKLSAGQVYALRFAPDEELLQLVERAVRENLSADEIKRSVKNWLPDEMRV